MELKWIALISLIFQNSGLAIMMRYTFLLSMNSLVNQGEVPGTGVVEKRALYMTSTAVLIAELIKLVLSFVIAFVLESPNHSVYAFLKVLYDEVIDSREWFSLLVPAILYTLQNSLQYYSMSCLSAPVFQVLYQMKIITTAVFSVFILSKSISYYQWLSIFALSFGVAIVQLSQFHYSKDGTERSNSFLGLLSVMMGCITSGFAGVYFELVLKGSKVSLWIRNIQLAIIGILCSSVSCYMQDMKAIQERGFLSGYNRYVWAVIVLQVAGGLIVAVVVKYADNVLKGFATSLSILISSVVSFYFFHDIEVNFQFIEGAAIVLGSVFVYGNADSTSKNAISTSNPAGPKK